MYLIFYYFFLRNDDITNIQSNICGQLGTIALMLHYIYYSINNTEKFDDILIDNYLSSIDAAFMVKPYMDAEEKNIEKTLINVYKVIYCYLVNVPKLSLNMILTVILIAIKNIS